MAQNAMAGTTWASDRPAAWRKRPRTEDGAASVAATLSPHGEKRLAAPTSPANPTASTVVTCHGGTCCPAIHRPAATPLATATAATPSRASLWGATGPAVVLRANQRLLPRASGLPSHLRLDRTNNTRLRIRARTPSRMLASAPKQRHRNCGRRRTANKVTQTNNATRANTAMSASSGQTPSRLTVPTASSLAASASAAEDAHRSGTPRPCAVSPNPCRSTSLAVAAATSTSPSVARSASRTMAGVLMIVVSPISQLALWLGWRRPGGERSATCAATSARI